MKILLALCLSLLLLDASSFQTQPMKSKQIIAVTTADWNTSLGTLKRFEMKQGKWHKVGNTIDIKLGRNGLAWGIGLHHIPNDSNPIKKEGDGKAPAGIFELSQGFGYEPFSITYPYKVYKEHNHCVDDVDSKFYNQIVDSTKISQDYKSFEHMKFPKDYYKYGVVVEHNPKAKKGAGSCIFLHIKTIPTAGCTVMNESQMKEILKWLDANKHPRLIQAPQGVIEKLLPFRY